MTAFRRLRLRETFKKEQKQTNKNNNNQEKEKNTLKHPSIAIR
jgi:hypothetical protein